MIAEPILLEATQADFHHVKGQVIQAEPIQVEAIQVEPGTKDVPPRTEEINGQHIRVGSLEEFVREGIGLPLKRLPRLASGKYGLVTLGVEKFKTSQGKFYRLIWVCELFKEAWLASEDDMDYCCKGNAVIVGYEIADELRVSFDEGTR
jgi:hypothetical protein